MLLSESFIALLYTLVLPSAWNCCSCWGFSDYSCLFTLPCELPCLTCSVPGKKKNPDNIFTRVMLDIYIYIYINPGRTDIFRMLNLLIQECSMSFHLLKSLCLFKSVLKFFTFRFCKILVKLMPRYFICNSEWHVLFHYFF